MRALLVAALALPLAFVGTLAAPLAGAPTALPLEAASLEAAPDMSAPCVPATPAARLGAGYVQLRWAPCAEGTRYVLLRGADEASLSPLVELGHPGHVDIAVDAGTVYYYAVEVADARSPAILVALPDA